MPSTPRVERKVNDQERELLHAMASDVATDKNTRKRAKAVLIYLETGDLSEAVARSGLSIATVRKQIQRFDECGWQNFLTIQSPRGGDFLSRYDQGYWAERLARLYLDNSNKYRAIPYGTSRSEPFTDQQSFRAHVLNDFLLQAWSSGKRWKRPDLILIPREILRENASNDAWTPDLIHWDNDRCNPYIIRSAAAVEVETSLWQVSKANVQLSFTVKDEDLERLRSWVDSNLIPLYIFQVFYDEAHVLPFSTLELLIGPDAPPGRRINAESNRFTNKPTYMIPLNEGTRLGSIPEPDVEGRIFKAENGRVTVYGRLTGSHIEALDRDILESLAEGKLR